MGRNESDYPKKEERGQEFDSRGRYRDAVAHGAQEDEREDDARFSSDERRGASYGGDYRRRDFEQGRFLNESGDYRGYRSRGERPDMWYDRDAGDAYHEKRPGSARPPDRYLYDEAEVMRPNHRDAASSDRRYARGGEYDPRHRQSGFGRDSWTSMRNERANDSAKYPEFEPGQYERRHLMGSNHSGLAATTRRGFKGVGPRNYVRPKERVIEDVNQAFADHDALDASHIDVAMDQGEVIVLKGTVPSRACKRLAEDLAERISGVRDVRNELRIEQSQGSTPSGTLYGTDSDNDRLKH